MCMRLRALIWYIEQSKEHIIDLHRYTAYFVFPMPIIVQYASPFVAGIFLCRSLFYAADAMAVGVCN